MPAPTFVFGFIVATLLGASFHLIFGGDARRLALFLLSGWAGFSLGHLAGGVLNMGIMNVGALHFLPAMFFALGAVLFSQALTAKRAKR
jgi:hypothetical protein